MGKEMFKCPSCNSADFHLLGALEQAALNSPTLGGSYFEEPILECIECDWQMVLVGWDTGEVFLHSMENYAF